MRSLIFGLAAIFLCSRLASQEADSSGLPLEEVVVTATKFPLKTSATGKIVQVITREDLERSGSKMLSQALTEQAGIYINGANSNYGKDKSVFVRGAPAEYTLITIDGVPVYDPSGIGSQFDVRNLSIDQVERIEILKGSQSTLYGSDAIAGVINIILRKPAKKHYGVDGTLQYGSNETFRGEAALSGNSGNIDYRVGYSYLQSDGISEAATKDGSPEGDDDGFEQDAVHATIGINLSGKVRLQPFFRYNKIEGEIDQGAFTDELDYTYEQKNYTAGLRNRFIIGKSQFYLNYNFNSINRVYVDDSTLSRNGFDTWARGSYQGNEHIVDAYLVLPVRGASTITLGSDYRYQRSDQRYSSIGFFGTYQSFYSKDSLRQNQVGIYTALNFAGEKKFNAELGSRLNLHSEYGSHFVFNFNPSIRINKSLKIFANLSSGYRTPSLYQLYSEYGNTELDPESSLHAEAGVQSNLLQNNFGARVSGFYRKVNDVIFFYFDPVTYSSQYINQDEQKDYGAEVELWHRINDMVTLKANYTYVTGEITTIQNGKDTTFFNLLRRPTHSGNVYAGFKITERFFASVNVLAVGGRKDAYFDNSIFQTVNVELPGYLLADVYGEYGLLKNRLKMFVNLRNVANKDYSEAAGFNALGFTVDGGVRVVF